VVLNEAAQEPISSDDRKSARPDVESLKRLGIDGGPGEGHCTETTGTRFPESAEDPRAGLLHGVSDRKGTHARSRDSVGGAQDAVAWIDHCEHGSLNIEEMDQPGQGVGDAGVEGLQRRAQEARRDGSQGHLEAGHLARGSRLPGVVHVGEI
jgi:hypothetical protein